MEYHVDGSLVDARAATLRVDHRGVALGDAASEPVRAYDGVPFAWPAHAERLFDACRALAIDPGVDAADIERRIRETIDANGFGEALVRVSVVRGDDADGSSRIDAGRLRPSTTTTPTVEVTATPLSGPTTGGSVTLQTVSTRATRADAVPAAPATHNRLDAVCAQAELRRTAPPDDDPADEALLRDADGRVIGGAASDPFFVDADAVHAPALGDRWPRTATRSVVRSLADEEGIPVVVGAHTPADIRDAAEAFVAEPTAGIRPIDRLDGVAVGGGAVTDLLSQLYAERVNAACR
jgi:branched-chain amino acid aminotransferase